MIGKACYVGLVGFVVAVIGVQALHHQLPLGPVVLSLTLAPLFGLLLAKRSLFGTIPDLVFGVLDTGLLTIPALCGGLLYGVAGAIAGGIIGDALTDAIAGFFEGRIAEWLREKGIDESREPVTSALGKMCGCLLGSGLVLSLALLLGIRPEFG